MSAAVTYMIRATAGDTVVQLPVRRVAMPRRREAARLIRAQYPGAQDVTVQRSVQAHMAWAASGVARRLDLPARGTPVCCSAALSCLA